jgi:Fe2+ or Zn2+ uptake regulation protein
MVWINPQKRRPLKEFRGELYRYIRANNKRYSDRREQVLKMLYTQSIPLSIETILKRLGEEHPEIGYATVARHIHFFDRLGWLHVTRRKYLLKAEAIIDPSAE